MMQAGVQSYFAINQAQDTIAAKQHGNVLKSPFMTYGSFATYIHPNQHGMIFGGNFKGMMMDIDQLMYQAVSKDNDSNELKGFIQSQGPRESANEHLVPEQLFDDPNTKEKEVEGVSAVKAIQIAQEQGQTIYHITKDNYSQVLPKLKLSSSVLTDIRNAVNAGRVVTTHEKMINYKGWKGSGYIIIDPQAGSGAYLIDGGANGGFAFVIGSLVGSLVALTLLPIATPAISTIVLLGPYLLFALSAMIAFLYLYYDSLDELSKVCFWLGFGFGFSVRLGIGTVETLRGLFQLIGGIGVTLGTGWRTGLDQCFK